MRALRVIRGDATSPQAKGAGNDFGLGATQRWERIEPIITETLLARDVATTVYDFD